MSTIDTEIYQLAERTPVDVLRRIDEDEKNWNKRFRWTEYTWNGIRSGRKLILGKIYRENGAGPELNEEQFMQRRKEYILNKLKEAAEATKQREIA